MKYQPTPSFPGGPPKIDDFGDSMHHIAALSVYEEEVEGASLPQRAEWYADAAHKSIGQTRKSGEDYIVHPHRVVTTARGDGRLSDKHLAALYLHDVVEDTPVTKEDLEVVFGMEVANLVDWMTNKSKATGLPRGKRKKLDRDRLREAPMEVKLMKLHDRFDNISDMSGYSDSFKRIYAKETLQLVEVLKEADPELAEKVRAKAQEILDNASRMPLLGHEGFVRFRHLNEAQALKNHSQTLERLAQRGGLGAAEMVAVIDRFDIFKKIHEGYTEEKALEDLEKKGVLEHWGTDPVPLGEPKGPKGQKGGQ